MDERVLRQAQDERKYAAHGELVEPRAQDDRGAIGPVQFAADVLGVTLLDKQCEVLEAVRRERRVAVKSGNGLGKGFTAAVAVLWYLHCHNPGIVLSTAPTFRQVRHVLWRQIHRLHRGARRPLGGTLLDTRWELARDRYALGLSADGADQFQGFHCENVLVVVDEAEGVAEEIYEAVDAVMTSRNPRLLLIGNPTRTDGSFHRAFHEERGIYRAITISALDSPNLRAGEVKIPGLVTAEWVEERRIAWRENSDLYRARVLGEFPQRGEDNLIAMDDIEAAVYEGVLRQAQDERKSGMQGERKLSAQGEPQYSAQGEPQYPAQGEPQYPAQGEPQYSAHGEPQYPAQGEPQYSAHGEPQYPAHGELVEPYFKDERVVIGVDVARFGSDRSVVLMRRGDAVASIRTFSRIDTMAVAGQVMVAVREHRPDLVNVDVIGVGAGLADRLREQGVPARDVNVAERPRRDRTCANLRAEGYRTLARRFRDRRIRIPRDAELIAELAMLRYGYDSRGRLLMEPKDSMKKRGGRSPDKADALMLAFLDDRGDTFFDEFFMDERDGPYFKEK